MQEPTPMLGRLLCLLFLLIASDVAAWTWVSPLPAEGCVTVWQIATDPAGDVVAAGDRYPYCPDSYFDSFVVKLRSIDGMELWQTVDGTPDDCERPFLLDVGPDGTVVHVDMRWRCHTDTFLPSHVIGLTADDGEEAWRRVFSGGGGVPAAGVDEDGNLVTQARGLPTKISVVTGETLWTADAALFSGWEFVWPRQMSLDAEGNVLLAAIVLDDPELSIAGELRLAKLTGATGALVWQRVLPFSFGPNTRLVDVGADSMGNLVVLVYRSDLLVVSLDGETGEERWRRDDAARAPYPTKPAAIGGGAIVFAGFARQEEGPSLVVVTAIDEGDGAVRWERPFDAYEHAGVAVDAAGDAIALFDDLVIDGNGDDRRVARLVKLDGSTGAERWGASLDGVLARGLALDDAGDVVVSGSRSPSVWPHIERVIMKRSGLSGADFPCGNGTLDPGETCDDGNGDDGDECPASCGYSTTSTVTSTTTSSSVPGASTSTSTTEPVAPSTTTTTLPGCSDSGGCGALVCDDGDRCTLDRLTEDGGCRSDPPHGTAGAACRLRSMGWPTSCGQLPPRATRAVARADRFVHHALASGQGGGQERPVRRALRALRRGARASRWGMRVGRVKAECLHIWQAGLAEARSALREWLAARNRSSTKGTAP